MNKVLYKRLTEAAAAQRVVYYSQIASIANLDMTNPPDRAEIGRLPGEISEAEHEQGRPLLSAVAISHDGNRPGDGFFTLARELGLHRGSDDDAFWTAELERVHRYGKPQGAKAEKRWRE
jgi:hypothetical protein